MVWHLKTVYYFSHRSSFHFIWLHLSYLCHMNIVMHIIKFAYQFMFMQCIKKNNKYNTIQTCRINAPDNTRLIFHKACCAQMTPVWYSEVADDSWGRGSLFSWCSYHSVLQVKYLKISGWRPKGFPKGVQYDKVNWLNICGSKFGLYFF